MSLLRNVLLKWCSSFQFEIPFRKIQIIIDIENWLYKSEFCKLPRTRNSLSQYGHNRPIWIKVRSWWQVLPQHQSTYLRGPESPLLKFPFQTKTYLVKVSIQGVPKVSGRFFKNGCGIQMSQATPTKFSMLFKHNYGKLFWKFGDHSFNFHLSMALLG